MPRLHCRQTVPMQEVFQRLAPGAKRSGRVRRKCVGIRATVTANTAQPASHRERVSTARQITTKRSMHGFGGLAGYGLHRVGENRARAVHGHGRELVLVFRELVIHRGRRARIAECTWESDFARDARCVNSALAKN